MTSPTPTRRQFIQTTAASAAATATAMSARSYARVLGANDRILIGQIGCGDRGRQAHMQQIRSFSEDENCEIIAVCDPWKSMREEAAALVKKWWNRDAAQFSRYQDLIALKEIDAVAIASPDHLHAVQLTAAAEAGKDAYVEKPWALTLDDLKMMTDAVKKNKRIVQAGTQLRSMNSFSGVRQLVQSGALGKIIRASQVRNSAEPYWHRYAERPIRADEVDWKAFLGDRLDLPLNPKLLSGWYGYRHFSSGPIGGLMSHFIDLVHYITGETYPKWAVTLQGQKVFDDDFTCPENVQTILEYPSGMLVSYATLFGNAGGNLMHWQGTRGMVDSTEWAKPT
ncbi:MAG: Gfo/Idh/MocA family oxidoreductase, partial [Candidatus Sumerlaeia bacterium]|nr:Gfo/Idh/MocA family oxidoreductase [Candidatus Sumerlaeia bacterium]